MVISISAPLVHTPSRFRLVTDRQVALKDEEVLLILAQAVEAEHAVPASCHHHLSPVGVFLHWNHISSHSGMNSARYIQNLAV